MEFINSNSTFNLKSESDLFSIPAVQNTIEEGYFQEYRPVTPLSDDAPLEFLIPAQTMEYLDLSLTRLHLKLQIFKKNGNLLKGDTPATEKVAAVPGDNVAPINNLLHSLFSNVELFLNKKCVSASNMYHYRAYIENLLNYGSDAKSSHFGSLIWKKDTAGYMDSLIAADNQGFSERKDMFAKSCSVDLEGNLHCDLFNQNKHLLNGVEVNLKLHLNRNRVCLMSTTDDYKIKLKEATLVIRKLKYNPTVMIAHAKTLLHTTAKYHITRVEMKSITIPQYVQNKTLDNIFLGQLPKRIILGLVSSNAYNGTSNLNPFNFRNFGVCNVRIVSDSYIRSEPYSADFTNGQYISCYNGLFMATGKHQRDMGNEISRNEYPNGYCLFAFDLTPDFCANNWNIQRSGSLGIDLKFSTPLDSTITALVFAEFDNLVEIDKDRNILTDYCS